MGKDKRTNCCSARIYHDKGGMYCFKCRRKVIGSDLHEVTTRATVKLELQNK